jgi:hypothetical protein
VKTFGNLEESQNFPNAENKALHVAILWLPGSSSTLWIDAARL